MPKIRQFLDGLRTSAPEPIRWIQGGVFFCHLEELAPGLPEDEVASLAELTLEELSPFPIEQLAWGYLHDAEQSRLFLYAAFHDTLRLQGESVDGWVRDTYVLPDFLPLLLRTETAPAQARFFLSGQTLSAALFRAGEPYPDAVLCEPLTLPADEAEAPLATEDDTSEELPPAAIDDAGEVSPEAIDAAQARLFSQFDRRVYPPLREVSVLVRSHLDRKEGGAAFERGTYRQSNAEAPAEDTETISLKGDNAVWQADVRKGDFKRRERSQRKLAGKLWIATQVAAALVLLLIVLEGGLLVFGHFAGERQAAQADMQDEVDVLLTRKDNLSLMQQFSGRVFEPFQLLRVLHQPMPSDFYFQNAVIARPDRARIQARFAQGSGSIALVNRYVEELESTGLFNRIEESSTVRGPDVFLDLEAEFKAPEDFPEQLSYQPPQPNTEPEPGRGNATAALLQSLQGGNAPAN
ncbi:MAG: hypothetical protein ACFB20_01595 [Opitutales bacterium]